MIKSFTLVLAITSTSLFGQLSEVIFVTESVSNEFIEEVLSPFFDQNKVRFLRSSMAIPSSQRKIWAIEVPESKESQVIDALLEYSFVTVAERNGEVREVEIERYEANDPYLTQQWAADNDDFNPGTSDSDINLPETWFIEKGSNDVILAIVDSGVNENHPEFSGRMYTSPTEVFNGIDDDNNGYIDDISGWDFIENDYITNDQRGHGTAVAGVAAANGDNNIGIAGVDWNCSILDVRVLNANGSGSFDAAALGIYYAVNAGADVINLSLGSSVSSSVMLGAVSYALSKGVLVVAAMGNFGDATLFYPAAFSGVFSVGATNYFDRRCNPFILSGSGGSNYGQHIDVVAPGDYIVALSHVDLDDYTDFSSGTSLAAPFVSGLASLLLAQDPTRSVADLKWRIASTADDTVGSPIEDRPGFDPYYGYGRINAYRAISSDFSGSGSESFRVTTDFEANLMSILISSEAEEVHVTTIDGKLIYSEQSVQPGIIELEVAPGVYLAYMIKNGTLYSRKVVII